MVKAIDARSVPMPSKTVDQFYLTPEYQRWREAVISRAGRRCQASDGGLRCTKAEPSHRMFADHIKERRDNGEPYDIANGQCLCGHHHTIKTSLARAERMANRTR